MKIKYKIYPTLDGRWLASWELTKEQQRAERNLAWFHTWAPEKAKVWPWNRSEEKPKLEQLCKEYAAALCKEIEREAEAVRLMDEAPLIEYGCSGDVQS